MIDRQVIAKQLSMSLFTNGPCNAYTEGVHCARVREIRRKKTKSEEEKKFFTVGCQQYIRMLVHVFHRDDTFVNNTTRILVDRNMFRRFLEESSSKGAAGKR